jgi:hypothetical protein
MSVRRLLSVATPMCPFLCVSERGARPKLAFLSVWERGVPTQVRGFLSVGGHIGGGT